MIRIIYTQYYLPMKNTLLFFSLLFIGLSAFGQAPSKSLTLEQCYGLAKQNYPLIKQAGLIEKSRTYNVENASKGYLPQFSMNGQATYQSAVTSLGISAIDIPHVIDVSIPTPYKDQFNIHGEVDQTIYDGGMIKQQKNSAQTDADISQKNLEVELYTLKDRVNQVFFGTLLIDQQLIQNDLLKKDIQNSIDKMQEAVNNGTALQSSLDELQANLLQQDQNEINLRANRKAYIDMLGVLINMPLDESTVLQSPNTISVSDSISRPELILYDFQKKSYDVQDKLLNAQNRPKLMFFVQGGYAEPGLDAFDVNFEWYYIGGLKLSWSFGGYYTLKNQRQLLDIGRETTDLNKETFLFNTKITMKQQSAQILNLQEMMSKDDEIVAKRKSIKESSKVQLEQGTITVHEYVGELDAEDEAKQNLILHKIQLLQAQYNYQNTTGN
jgi:outer membrane protein TolC